MVNLSSFLSLFVGSKAKKLWFSMLGAFSSVVVYSQVNTKLEIDMEGLDEVMREVILECPSIVKGSYRPTPYLPIGFFHLVFGGYVKKFDKNLKFLREKVEFEDGDYLTLGISQNRLLR